ncbi:MAG: cryptochrome/photolyase family protein, partial [Achromobacter piechaudii]
MASQRSGARALRLILGDQLNPLHSWFEHPDPGVVHVLMEVRQETDYVLHHAQKILAIFAAMRDFARHLREAGHRVRYVAIDDPSNRQDMTQNLAALMAHYGARELSYQQPDEWRVSENLRTWGALQTFSVREVDSEHFYASRDEVAEFFGPRRQGLMEAFYRHMRQRHGVLMDTSGAPMGGRWNFDHDNREPWPGTPPLPPDARPVHDHRALWETVRQAGVQSFGNPQAGEFHWPLNRAQALAWLDHFIQSALPNFGAYEDAMSAGNPRLFHSQLSFALNTKMLHPDEVVRQAQAAYEAGHAPLAAVEGFIRQILGWREYVRGVYWAHMPGYETRNALGHARPLPAWFWTGQTTMRCMRDAIGNSLENAYAHHIQRLMVIG